LKKKFEVRLNYISNVRPHTTAENHNTNIKIPRTLFAKRLLYAYIILVTMLGITTKYNMTIFLKKKKKKAFNILRAPYKNKIAQNSYM
jgi:hypothetical protein